MPKVLLFSNDPGGANTLILPARLLRQKGFQVSLFGKSQALACFREFGLKAKDLAKIVPGSNKKSLRQFLIKQRPDFIVTGTSATDFTEKFLWQAAKELGIPSFAILDHWMNYGLRFSRYGAGEIARYKKYPTVDFLPTKIFVMDRFAKMASVAEGLPANRVVALGQPYFELMRRSLKKVTPAALRRFRRRQHIAAGELVVTFASQPFIKSYGEAKALRQFGYTEKTAALALLSELKKLSDIRPITLLLKLHPREDLGNWKDLIKPFQKAGLKAKTVSGGNVWEFMKASDLICGINSMFLVEAVILGRKVVSIQIGSKTSGDFILERRGILNPARNQAILKKQLEDYLLKHKRRGQHFKIMDRPTLKIINYIQKYYGKTRNQGR